MKQESSKNQVSKLPVVILHGWGKQMNGKKYHDLQSILENNGYKVFSPDLPGFGENPLKKEELFFDDYVEFVWNFIENVQKKLRIKRVILLGHSFGGRIAIRFAATYPEKIEKLILTGASGIPRPLPSVKKKIAFLITKIVKPLFLIPPFSMFYQTFRKAIYYSIGEMDYYKAGNLTQTFKNVYKVSIVDDLKKISVPTLLAWGELDTYIPVADGKLMNKSIKNSKLVIIPSATHQFPYENPKEFAKIVVDFIND